MAISFKDLRQELTDEMLKDGNKLLVKGQFRSYNSFENQKNKLIGLKFELNLQ